MFKWLKTLTLYGYGKSLGLPDPPENDDPWDHLDGRRYD